MNKLIIIGIFLLLSSTLKAEDNLKSINLERIEINKNGMLTLGGWALSNIAIGSIGYFNTSGKLKYFHQMNVFWNSINLAIAGIGYYGTFDVNQSPDLIYTLNEINTMKNILLFNAGLDIGYAMTGLYLNELGKNKNKKRLKGYGNSIILQGAFLFTFDIIMYLFHNKNYNNLLNVIDNFALSGNKISFMFTF